MATHTPSEADLARLKEKVKVRTSGAENPEGDTKIRSLRKRLKRAQRKRRSEARRKRHAMGKAKTGKAGA